MIALWEFTSQVLYRVLALYKRVVITKRALARSSGLKPKGDDRLFRHAKGWRKDGDRPHVGFAI